MQDFYYFDQLSYNFTVKTLTVSLLKPNNIKIKQGKKKYRTSQRTKISQKIKSCWMDKLRSRRPSIETLLKNTYFTLLQTRFGCCEQWGKEREEGPN